MLDLHILVILRKFVNQTELELLLLVEDSRMELSRGLIVEEEMMVVALAVKEEMMVVAVEMEGLGLIPYSMKNVPWI